MTITNITNGRLNLTSSTPQVTSGNISYSNSTVLTNLMNLDPFFRGLNVTGDINISMQFEDFPTASFSLVTSSLTVAAQLKTRFTNFQTKHVIYGIPFRVSSYNENIQPLPNRRYEISIQMEGWNKYLVNKEITISFPARTLTYTLKDVAEKANVKITNINKTIPLSGELQLKTTVANVIATLVNDLGLTVDYVNETISLKKYQNSGNISITGDKILSLQTSYNQMDVGGFIYPPTYLEWNKKPSYDYAQELLQLQTKPKYEQIRDIETVVTNDPDNASRQRGSEVIIRDMSMNYDVSGETKTREVNTYRGQKIISSRVTVYGYAYISSQLYQSESEGWFGYGSGFWRPVEQYTIVYKYDNVDGYSLGYEKYGRKLVRFRTETDVGEHKSYTVDANNSKSTSAQRAYASQTANLYEFRWIPIQGDERLELLSYHSTYSDSAPQLDQIYETYEEFDSLLGRNRTKYERNKSFSMPMYVSKRSMFSNSFAYTVTPKDDPKQKTTYEITGEQQKEITKIQILKSKNTRYSGSTDEDKYIETTTVLTSQDSNFSNSFTHVTSNTSSGKPPQGQSYPVFKKIEQKNVLSQPIRNNNKIIVYANYTGNKGTTNSVYFDVKTQQEALSALKAQLEKRNLFSVNEFSFTTLFNSTLKPANNCSINYNNQIYNGTIKSINIPIKILNGTVAKCFMSVTCGQVLSNNQVNLETYIDKVDPNPGVFAPVPYTHGDADEIEQIYNAVSQRGNY